MYLEQSFNMASSLPKKYNTDNLVLICQNPHWLYAYWEITEKKKKNFEEQFGKNAWQTSRPVIKVVNITKNYHFFAEIKDDETHWYINVGDCACLYHIEIGRRLGQGIFVELLNSNLCFAPTDIALETSTKKVRFTNIHHLKESRKENSDRQQKNIFIDPEMALPFTLNPGAANGFKNSTPSYDINNF